jgi:hypothetical protein
LPRHVCRPAFEPGCDDSDVHDFIHGPFQFASIFP